MSTVDLKKQLQNLENEAHRLREKIENSEIVPHTNGATAEFVEEWDFGPANKGHVISQRSQIVLDALSAMKIGDKVRIGPFTGEKEARRAQTTLHYLSAKKLGWPTGSTESHVVSKYLYVKRLK